MYERINNKHKKEIFVLKSILNTKDNNNKSILNTKDNINKSIIKSTI